MINGFNIINTKDGEKILILYVDNNVEFGIDFNLKHKNSNMKKQIKSYIKKNKIKFDGEKIALSIGGVVLACLLLIKNPSVNNDFDVVYLNNSILPKTEVALVIDSKVENKEENEEKIVEQAIPENDVINDNIRKEIVDEKYESNNSSVERQVITSDDLSTEDVVVEQKHEEEKVENAENIVTIYRNNGQVLKLTMDDYLIGVVGAEMPASFNLEALKAQAVIARTYALKKIQSGAKLTDSVSAQSYQDNNELRNKWGNSFDMYYQKIKDAVLSTNNKAIYYNGKYIDAVYHSTSNGKTEDSKYVWGNDIPYLKSVDSSWDISASSYLRNVTKDVENVLNILGVNANNFSIISRNESGRITEIKVGDKSFTGVEFRNLLGLRSADFDINVDGNAINIVTRGYGHGVGLSQYGANGMANDGYNYQDIIKHYYTGVDIY